MVQYSIGSFLWLASAFNDDFLHRLYLFWNGFTQWWMLAQMLWIVVARVISFAGDTPTRFSSYSNQSRTYGISKYYKNEFWQVFGMFMFLNIQLGFYPDLKEIGYLMDKQDEAGPAVKPADADTEPAPADEGDDAL